MSRSGRRRASGEHPTGSTGSCRGGGGLRFFSLSVGCCLKGFAEVCQLHLLAASPESTSAAMVTWFGRGRMSLLADDGWPWAAASPRSTISTPGTPAGTATEHPAMNSNPAAKKSTRPSPTRLSLLDIAIARNARRAKPRQSRVAARRLLPVPDRGSARGARASRGRVKVANRSRPRDAEIRRVPLAYPKRLFVVSVVGSQIGYAREEIAKSAG